MLVIMAKYKYFDEAKIVFQPETEVAKFLKKSFEHDKETIYFFAEISTDNI